MYTVIINLLPSMLKTVELFVSLDITVGKHFCCNIVVEYKMFNVMKDHGSTPDT